MFKLSKKPKSNEMEDNKELTKIFKIFKKHDFKKTKRTSLKASKRFIDKSKKLIVKSNAAIFESKKLIEESRGIKKTEKYKELLVNSNDQCVKLKILHDADQSKLDKKLDSSIIKSNKIIEESKLATSTQKQAKLISKSNKIIEKSRRIFSIKQIILNERFDKKIDKSKKTVCRKQKRLLDKSNKFENKSKKLIKKSKVMIRRSKYRYTFVGKMLELRDRWYDRPSRAITKKMTIRRNIIKWTAIAIIALSIVFLTLTYLESTGFSFFDKWSDSSQSSEGIDFGAGITHTEKLGAGALQKSTMQVIITFFGGGALGLAGALLQKITKNRLAEVSILGIGSLNILFIYIYAMSLKDKAFGNGVWGVLMPVFLIIVSVFGTLLVWVISRSRKANKNTFVIVGIALQLLVEALSVIVVNPTKLNKASTTGGGQSQGKEIWDKIKGYTLGDVRNDIGNPKANYVEWWLIFLVIGIVIAVIATLFFLRRKIDAYETSEELASATGVNIKRLRLTIYLLVALLAGAASSTLGTVALLGIIAPSVARLLFKNRFWPMAIASFIIGGMMVSLAAFLSLQVGWGVPVGILSTAIVIPYFLFLMVREK